MCYQDYLSDPMDSTGPSFEKLRPDDDTILELELDISIQEDGLENSSLCPYSFLYGGSVAEWLGT